MKEKIVRGLIVSIFVVGMGIFFYPMISNYLMNKNQTVAIQNYQYTVEQMQEDETKKVINEAKIYNDKLNESIIEDVFSTEAMEDVDSEYKNVLNIGGIMGYLEIPKINIKLAIYHGTSEEVISKGVGHIETTALPIGGIGNHSVLSSHRGLASAKLFTDLDKLEIGDMFYINILSERLEYVVDQIKVVEPTDTKDLQAEVDKDYITLLTCTPYAINTHRLLVRGSRVIEQDLNGQNNNELENNSDKLFLGGNHNNQYIKLFVIVIVALSIIFIIMFLIRRNIRKSKKNM